MTKLVPSGIILVNTATESWQIECWRLARMKVPFHIAGATTLQNHYFFEELKAAYGYTVVIETTHVAFMPLNWRASVPAPNTQAGPAVRPLPADPLATTRQYGTGIVRLS